jgi:hypothetical protein
MESHALLNGINGSEKVTCQNHKWRQCSSASLILWVLFTFNSFSKSKPSTKLIMRKYWSTYLNLCIKKAWTLAQQLDSPPWQCSSSQGSFCQLDSGGRSVTEV